MSRPESSGAERHRPARCDEPAELGSQGRPARVLVIVEQVALTEVICMALNHGRFTIRTAQQPEDGLREVAEWHPHLGLVDMEFGEGVVLDELKRMANPIPVIALTRRSGLEVRLDAFKRGAEDILTRPFSPEELLARALVAMRRIYREPVAFTPVIRFRDLEINILHRRVRVGEHQLHLTSVEQSLLYLFVANAGRLLTRDDILDDLWGADFTADSNLVDRHIRNLRAKLADDWRRPRYIATVPNKGYRFLERRPAS